MDTSLQDIFIPEAEDNLGILEERLIDIEERPDDSDVVNEAFRAMHSIKGGAGLAGFPEMQDFTHVGEDLLEMVRSGKIAVSADVISALLSAIDIIKAMIANIRSKTPVEQGLDTESVVKKLKNLINATPSKEDIAQAEKKTAAKAEKKVYFLKLKYSNDLFRTGIDPLMYISDLEKDGEVLAIQMDTHDLPEDESFDPENLYVSWKCFYQTAKSKKDIETMFCFVIDDSDIEIVSLNEHLQDDSFIKLYTVNDNLITKYVDVPKAVVLEKEEVFTTKIVHKSESVNSSYIRVHTDKLEKIFNTVSELIISESNLNMLTIQNEADLPEDFLSVADSIRTITQTLQEQSTSLRMMSLKSTFDRFKRIVRDTSLELDKKIHLEISGQDTELDKNMIEKLNDPLKHIIRNSIDHGIETEEERASKNKPIEGILKLAAYIEDGKVIIEVSDDGKGLDSAVILKKAREKGLVSDGSELSEKEIFNLIFEPGFSTAKEVTELSGRGVGMDVVKTTINELHGNVEIISKKDVGTTIKLYLPLTLAILDGMLVRVSDERYIVPTLSILEILRPEERALKTISGNGEVVFFRGDYIPLVRISEVFSVKGAVTNPTEAELIVITSLGVKAALLVDTVQDQYQVVLKSLEQNFTKMENISSATILGDGKVALILDVQNIISNYAKS